MAATENTLLLIDGNDPALGEWLDPDNLAESLGSVGVVKVIRAPSNNKKGSAGWASEAIAKNGPAGVVIAGGARFLDSIPDVIRDEKGETAWRPYRVNLVERCAFLHEDAGAIGDLALRQLAAAVAAARASVPLVFVDEPVERRVAVIGCGASAQLAAGALVEQGLPVTMIAGPDSAFGKPSVPPYVEFIRDATITGVNGTAGRFRITLENGNGPLFVEAGAIVVAARPSVRPLRLSGELALSGRATPLSAWAVQLEDLPSAERVCIWMDHQGQESRASAYTTFVAAEQALDLGYEITLLFRTVPVYGDAGQLRYDRIREAGATLIRYDEDPAWELVGDRIRLTVRDVILPEDELTFDADRLVIPEKLLPSAMNEPLAKLLRQPLDEDGFFQPNNVRYLPVGSPKRGVLYVGSAHRDVDPDQTADEAKAAAVQIGSLLDKPVVSVPRELVTVDKTRCASCLTCVRSCRHDAVHVSPTGRSVEFDADACWECGICAAVCPREAIARSGFSKEQLEAAIAAASGELSGQRPSIVFLCRNSAADALEAAGRLHLAIPDNVVWIEVPCAGHISENEVVEALVGGADRVQVFGCHHDNCRSQIGSVSAHRRTDSIRRSLAAMGLAEDAVQFHSIAANEPYRLVHLLWNHRDEAAAQRENRGAAHG